MSGVLGFGLSRCFRLLLCALVCGVAGLVFLSDPAWAVMPSLGAVSPVARSRNSTITSLAIAKPSSTAEGDLLVAAISTDGSVTFTVPSDWTLLNQGPTPSNAATLAVFYKIAGPSEPADYTFAWNVNEQAVGVLLRYINVDTNAPINISAPGTTGDPDHSNPGVYPLAPGVTTTAANTMVVRIFGADGNARLTSGYEPAGHTGRFSDRSSSGGSNGVSLGVADIPQVLPGATDSAAFTYGAFEEWRTITIALTSSGIGCADYRNNGTSPTNLSGVVNTYYPGVAGKVSAGATTIPVGTPRGAGATPIAAGDLLLVLQMQDAEIDATNSSNYGDGATGRGATSYGHAGQYEFVVAGGAVSGGAVPIRGEGMGGGLLYPYVQAAYSGVQGQQTYQVIRVPQYQTATVTGTVTGLPWDGSSGGVVAIDVVGQLTFSGGSINVDGQGFRGGGGQALNGGSGTNTDYLTLATNGANGNKGEGVAGVPRYLWDGSSSSSLVDTNVEGYPNGSRARGAPGNGGGGATDGNPASNDQNSGGGGGGNGGIGGVGGYTWSSCRPRGGLGGADFPHASNRLVLGGGGGSGARNNSVDIQSSGGMGGGIILIRTDSIYSTAGPAVATLSANGAWPAPGSYTPANDGGGGGGAGGSILVFARTGDLTSLRIQADGAKGSDSWPDKEPGTSNENQTGSANNRHGPGGGGAGGVLYLSGLPGGAGSTSVAGGSSGTTTTAHSAFGATAGANGSVTYGLTGAVIPGTSSGAACNATLAGIASFGASVEDGQVVVEWRTGFEIGTVGFYVEREDSGTGSFVPVNDRILPGLLTAPQGGTYRLVDEAALPGETYTYRLVELDAWGDRHDYGPYSVVADVPPTDFPAPRMTQPEPAAGSGLDDPARGYRAAPNPLRSKTGSGGRVPHPSGSPSLRENPTAAGSPAQPLRLTAAGGYAQVTVRDEGLVSIASDDLATALGLSETQVVNRIKRGTIEVSRNGEDVAWLGRSDGKGLVFFGERMDSLYTLDNVYCFKPAKGVTMAALDSRPKASVQAGVFTDTIVFEKDLVPATLAGTDPESDYWFWEGFIGGNTPDWSRKSFALNLPEAVAGISLTVRLNGVSSTGHPFELRFNGRRLGKRTFPNLGAQHFTFSLAGASILSGENTVEVVATGDAENMFFLDSFEVTYTRNARAVADRVKISAAAAGPLAVEGFQSPDILVFDITNPQLPTCLAGPLVDATDTGSRVTFVARTGHKYLAATLETATPLQPHPALSGNLRNKGQVDYVVITNEALAGEAENLAALRQGRGLSTRVVLLDAIYNDFSYGIADPRAIRSFLNFIQTRWGTRYAVLVGSGTFDYRDILGMGDNLVPTLMTATPYGLFACDSCFSESQGGPGVIVSRIPASDPVQLHDYIAKLTAYEELQGAGTARDVLMLADIRDPQAGNFPGASDDVASRVPSDIPVQRVYLSEHDGPTARQMTIGRINAGVAWVNYIGHGGMDRLSSEGLLASGDQEVLGNLNALPVLSAFTCSVNRFEIPGTLSLGEELLLDGNGGAIAVLAPSGLSQNEPATRLNRALFKEVFQAGEPLLGDAVHQAFLTRPAVPPFMRGIYNLLGDPVLLLRK